MSEDKNRFSQFVTGQSGYFRENCEHEFPWHLNDRSVWYALFVIEGMEISKYGFTSSKANKDGLCAALEALTDSDKSLLIGIWNGQYCTHLFVLDRSVALSYLKGDKRFARFSHLGKAINVFKTRGPKGGFRYISYEYQDEDGVPVHVSCGDRDEAAELESFFQSLGIEVREERCDND